MEKIYIFEEIIDEKFPNFKKTHKPEKLNKSQAQKA